MRLVNCDTLLLEKFSGEEKIPPYAILSHSWGKEEVTYAEIMTESEKPREESMSGDAVVEKWAKVVMASQTAKEVYGLDYIWIDTCCIDKSSSAELTEAINSMWKWYWKAEVCIAYLADFVGTPFHRQSFVSRWFTRGWTLQELIAPARVDFFNKDWNLVGDRILLSSLWCKSICNVDRRVLVDGGRQRLHEFSVATRLSWASRRKTTRSEDRAYSLLGLFGVSMTALYGEGYESAFLRLQMKIYKQTADQSLFAWQMPSSQYKIPRPKMHPWKCKIYGDTNPLCQNPIPDVSGTMIYADAFRPWRLNNKNSHRSWTTNTKPIQTTYLFAPNLECFDAPWHLKIIPAPSFTFPYTADLPTRAWSFISPAPSRRYGPRTQVVMSRIASWFAKDTRYSFHSEVEYALYLALLPIHILQAQPDAASANSFESVPSAEVDDGCNWWSPTHYVAVHLLECSQDPGIFRRANPMDVFVVNMKPLGKLEDYSYFPQGWTDKPHVRDSIFRVEPLQEVYQLKTIGFIENMIDPKVRDVFLSRPMEGDFTYNPITTVKPMDHRCVRLQWLFMETGRLEQDGWIMFSDTSGDQSGVQQTKFWHHLLPQNRRRRMGTRSITAWYRHPTEPSMVDNNAAKTQIRIFWMDKLADEGFGIILSTHPVKTGKRTRRYKDDRMLIGDEKSRENLEPWEWELHMTRIQVVSSKNYHSLESFKTSILCPSKNNEPGPNDDQVQLCCCPVDSEKQSDLDATTTSLSDVAITDPPSSDGPTRNPNPSTCTTCGFSSSSRALDACDQLITITLKSARKLTLGLVEPTRRIYDDQRLGPMVMLKVVSGGPEEWVAEVEQDEEEGVTGTALGESLWKTVGRPPVFEKPDPADVAREKFREENETVNIGGWGALALARRRDGSV